MTLFLSEHLSMGFTLQSDHAWAWKPQLEHTINVQYPLKNSVFSGTERCSKQSLPGGFMEIWVFPMLVSSWEVHQWVLWKSCGATGEIKKSHNWTHSLSKPKWQTFLLACLDTWPKQYSFQLTNKTSLDYRTGDWASLLWDEQMLFLSL